MSQKSLLFITEWIELHPFFANDKIKAITEILPGMNSPSILPLAKKGWSSIHSVINKSDFWDIIDALKENGAEGILVSSIDNMVL
jgi:ATP phosphoribosyltransferase